MMMITFIFHQFIIISIRINYQTSQFNITQMRRNTNLQEGLSIVFAWTPGLSSAKT